MLQPGTIFDSRYELVRKIGRGGFAEVWLVKDTLTGLEEALKIYAPGSGMDEDGLKIFAKELSVVHDLRHTNLLTPKSLGQYENQPYLVLPYCPNGSLNKLVGLCPEDEAWRILEQVASGLAYLHEQGIVHQDIKPDNILIDAKQYYVITDFGISLRAQSTLRKSMRDQANSGTRVYMAPERFSTEPRPIPANDIWSLGAMMFELIEGNVPFVEQMGGLAQKGGADIPTMHANVSDNLKRVIQSLLALNPDDRPTAAQLVELAKSKSAPSVSAQPEVVPASTPPPPPSSWELFKEWIEWHKPQFYGAVAFVLVLVVGGCYFVLRSDKPENKTGNTGGNGTGLGQENDPIVIQPDSTVNYLDTVRVYLSSNDGDRYRHSIDCIDEHKDEISNADALRDSIYDVWANELTKAREYSSAFDYAHGLGEQYRPLETRIQTNADAYFKTCIPSKCTSINQCIDWEKRVNGCTALQDFKKREYLGIIQVKKSSLDEDKPKKETKVKLNTFQLTKCNTSWVPEGTPVNIQEGNTIPYTVQKSTKYKMYLSTKGKFDPIPSIINTEELKSKGFSVKVVSAEATIRIQTTTQSQNATMKIKMGDRATIIKFKVEE